MIDLAIVNRTNAVFFSALTLVFFSSQALAFNFHGVGYFLFQQTPQARQIALNDFIDYNIEVILGQCVDTGLARKKLVL